ncbi:MAG: DUF3536 domain-containing protein [Elusimicrobiota bacterium]|jgi:alpha-amylase/alpha-mannosidase (GH57 family)|nr:DUF3536 domain-containing protein [Elusimicrobiota bacterium]
MNQYLCIHGHFYQPPRENPWLGEVETQESARPYKNWNERVTAECYYPNAFARILSGSGKIKDIQNNYSKISFNFGPTLLSWLQDNNPETYQAVLDADKKSQETFGGHGNAIAQVYNHIIMPLANERDKETQIIWGIKDFESRFKRAPEGMWLAETAVDTQTLAMLASNGIKFTILSPAQCKKTRKIGDKMWSDVASAKIDSKRPYTYNLPNGKSIVLFFYDGQISQSIAFGGMLSSGETFAKQLAGAFDNRREPQLVHIATDGETYGHHKRFGEMALAYCLDYIEKNKLAVLTNYGQYLEMFPPQYEAIINENTSWSCCHGIERWRADCGCRCDSKDGWTQKWRAPLRGALDFLRGKLLETFETKGKEYFHDIWAARNAFIDVILDKSKMSGFIEDHGTDAARADAPAAFKLMQMQLNAMLMYTSCGWFFDELSGIETVQIMAYAKRALGYNKAMTSADLEAQFTTKLAAAPSNIAEFENGAKIYEHFVKPISTGLRKIAINYGVSYLLDEILFEDYIYLYSISDQRVEVSSFHDAKLICGYASFTSLLTTETRRVSFALLYGGGVDIVAGAMYGCSSFELKKIKETFAAGAIEETKDIIKNTFSEALTMGGLMKSKQKQILARSIKDAQKRVQKSFEDVFNQEQYFLNYFKEVTFPMPQLIMNLAESVLNDELKREILKEELNENNLSKIMGNIKNIGVKIYEDYIKYQLTKRLNALISDYAADSADISKAVKATNYLQTLEQFSLPVDKYKSANLVFNKLKKMPLELKNNAALETLCEKLNLDV